MAADKRFIPIAFRKGIRRYSRDPKAPTKDDVGKNAHVLTHEYRTYMAYTKDQSDGVKLALQEIHEAGAKIVEQRAKDLGLTEEQAIGMFILAGYSNIIASTDVMRQQYDPLSRSAFLAQLLQLLQYTTVIGTRVKINDYREAAGATGDLSDLDTITEQFLEDFLDTAGCGEASGSYEHALTFGKLSEHFENLLDGAQTQQEATADEPQGEASPMPVLEGLNNLAESLGSLIGALSQIPTPKPKEEAPKPRTAARTSGSGVLAVEIREGETPEAFKKRLVDILVNDKGLPQSIADKLADRIVQGLANGEIGGAIDHDDDGDD